MLELRQPLDFERLPEFRLLVANLQRQARAHALPTPKHAEAIATFLWQRLWVDLGYLAQKTNRPGWLSRWGADEFRRSVGALFGEDGSGHYQPDPLALFCDGPEEVRSLVPLPDGEFECPMFARLNEQLAGDYVPKHAKGNQNSIISRQQKNIEQASVAQAMLFADKVKFTRPDGTELEATELNGCTVVIKNIDNSLGLPERRTDQFSQGLYADAFQVYSQYDKDARLKFYQWVFANRHNQAVPKSTEKILAEFAVWAKQAGIA